MGASMLTLIVVAAVAVEAVALAAAGAAAFRPLAALPLALGLPAYALAAALFPPGRLGGAERLTLGLGAGLAVTALGGLALNWTPWGLRAGAWAALLGGITLAATAIALARARSGGAGWRGALAALQVPTPRLPMLRNEKWRLQLPWPRPPMLRQALQFGLAAALVGGAVGVARLGAAGPSAAGFTQLWMLPAGAAEPGVVRLGVRSEERAPLRYSLRLAVGDSVVRSWASLELRPGERWETVVELPATSLDEGPLQAVLYRADAPTEAYRRVWLSREAGPQPSAREMAGDAD